MNRPTIVAIAAIGALAHAGHAHESLHSFSSPDRAFLGVLIADQDQDGLHVAGTSPDSGAAAAGLKAEDIIVAVNDESLLGEDRPLKVLHGVLESVAPGAKVRLLVLRDGEEHSFEVTTTSGLASRLHHRLRWLDELGDVDVDIDLPAFVADRTLVRSLRGPRRDGLRLADIGEDLGDYFGVDAGVLVLDTPAKSELKPGDILKRVDGAAVSSANDAYRLLRRLEQDAPAEVRRKNRKITVNVAAPDANAGQGDSVLHRQ